MSAIRFYHAFIMIAFFLVNAVGAASICKEDYSNPACNPNSLEFDPDYEYGYYRADNGTSRPNNGTGEGHPVFGNLGLVLSIPKLDLNIDFVIHFNGTVGREAGDRIDAELSSPLSNETMKFSLEYLALDQNGNVLRFIPVDDTDSKTIAPATTAESPTYSKFSDIGMICLKLPPDMQNPAL